MQWRLVKKSQGVPDMRGERDCQGPLQCPGTSCSECPGVKPREKNLRGCQKCGEKGVAKAHYSAQEQVPVGAQESNPVRKMKIFG